MKELTDEQLIAKIQLLFDAHTSEQEGLTPPTPEQWLKTVDDAWDAFQELATRYSALLERLSEVEKERDALKASVEGDLSSAIANMTRFGPDVCIACAEPHQWLVFGVRIDDRDGSVVEES